MADDLCRILVEDFLQQSFASVKALVNAAKEKKTENRKAVSLFMFKNNHRVNQIFSGDHFFLRGSVEYTNPQLTVEEMQGIIGTRLLEVCANFFYEKGMLEPEIGDVNQLCELLKKPPKGKVAGFLLNTDDVELDRYSMNPLKTSIVSSGQSAFPAFSAKTDRLVVDEGFAKKYEKIMICNDEVELIRSQLASSDGSYLDFVDSVKYAHIEALSEAFGIDLTLPTLRMPLTTLSGESKEGLIHHIISETHRDFDSIKQTYDCMGRSITKRTTLLTIPHSVKGYGSKRAARGRLYFSNSQLESVTIKYKDTLLYPNAMDPEDISIAKCEDSFTVSADKLFDYSFAQTPSSPQFFLYSIASPEDAALWHGIGAFAAPQLLQSYTQIRRVCKSGQLIRGLEEKFGLRVEIPLQLNLRPDSIWVHPTQRNIDASIGCVNDFADLARMGMRIDHLSDFK
jgi:hypothetical protein